MRSVNKIKKKKKLPRVKIKKVLGKGQLSISIKNNPLSDSESVDSVSSHIIMTNNL